MEKQNLKRFTMNVDHTNPDARVNFTSVGTGKTQKEAAVFALGMFYSILDGYEGEKGIEKYEDALGIVSDHLTDTENLDEIVDSLIEGKVEKNSSFFYNAYESTEVDYEFSEVEEELEGGIVTKMEVTETYY
jgi:hypothetical protein